MEILSKLLIGILIAILLSSCSSRNVVYFQDIDKVGRENLKAYHNYEPKIKKDDMINIIVSALNKDVVAPYNSDPSVYSVDIEGNITFPILGRLKVEGLTLRELSNWLTAMISKDVKKPVVNTSFVNYKVTILGEVRTPGTYVMPSERTTILQALGLAGDLTLGGKRDNVLLIREINGTYEHIKIDLRKSDILSSPHFYLCQNDVIYVAPTSSRSFSGSSQSSIIPLIASTIGIVISTIALILN
ncbi:polysaccharide biosynthesis/export family protein [Dysgonomonas sp. Marseille-P4677]|uniref:polysaccharide biosynthesis/export family protein n=1 Tax=Dysgonomonas sp. Marseille-P4677 TaxID=2364790 RepID=UPI001911F4FA|nr:polysaccharide biosynthesis/export family protein [Dysgonomonas sp. Marseille-P4677]MBK5721497.1 polysaccharide biosynthesis/export family protein [Dysgonomonas sp. Marseille-P4677]